MEHDLIKKLNERDEGACKIVFYALYPRFFTYVKREIINHHDAEDIVIRCFSVLFKSNNYFKDFGAIEAYLFTGIRNSLRNYRRCKKWFSEIIYDYPDEPDEEERYYKNIRPLMFLINKLPEKYKTILLLEIEGCTGAEIANKMNIKIDSVYQQRWRAINKIKEMINNGELDKSI